MTARNRKNFNNPTFLGLPQVTVDNSQTYVHDTETIGHVLVTKDSQLVKRGVATKRRLWT